LLGERLIAVCSPTLASSGSAAEALTRLPLLQLMPLPEAWSDWLRAAGVQRQVNVRGPCFENFGMAIEAAASGLGVLLVPDFLVQDDVARGRLIVPHPTSISTNMAYYLVYPKAKENLPWLRNFRDWLLTMAAATEASSD